jgi:hypothetical protein
MYHELQFDEKKLKKEMTVEDWKKIHQELKEEKENEEYLKELKQKL